MIGSTQNASEEVPMDYLQGLNEKQLEAVSKTEGYVRVIAGAGSGKTKLLCADKGGSPCGV